MLLGKANLTQTDAQRKEQEELTPFAAPVVSN